MSEQPAAKKGQARVRAAQDPSEALAARLPWKPGEFAPEDVGAIQALHRGDAAPHQQQRALKFIVELSRNGEAHYFPGENGRRDTDYALGRAHVGKQIQAMVNIRLKPLGEQR